MDLAEIKNLLQKIAKKRSQLKKLDIEDLRNTLDELKDSLDSLNEWGDKLNRAIDKLSEVIEDIEIDENEEAIFIEEDDTHDNYRN